MFQSVVYISNKRLELQYFEKIFVKTEPTKKILDEHDLQYFALPTLLPFRIWISVLRIVRLCLTCPSTTRRRPTFPNDHSVGSKAPVLPRLRRIVGEFRPFSTMASSTSVEESTVTMLNDERVKVTAAPGITSRELSLRNVIDSSLFQQWLKNIQSDSGLLTQGKMSLKHVHIQGVDMFGRGVGFLKFKADIIDKETGKKIPGIVFSRGQSVSVLILLESGGVEYAILTEQARVPVGKFILELPAGMLDDNDVVGTAVREVEEETGISLKLEDTFNLTDLLESSTGCKVFPSPGGCDEEISLLLYRGSVEQQVIDELQGKEMGLREHGELIKVHAVPYQKLWRMTADAKALCAIALYEMAAREGLLPPVDGSPEVSS